MEVAYSGTIPVFFLRKITEKLHSEYHVPWPKLKPSTSRIQVYILTIREHYCEELYVLNFGPTLC